MLKVREVGSEYDAEIEKFLVDNSSATFYHLPEWLNILERESNQTGIKLICTDANDKIVGYMPLLYTKGFPLGIGGILAAKRLSSLPRTPVGGPIASDIAAQKELIEKAVSISDKDNGRSLQLKTFADNLNETNKSLSKFLWRDIYVKKIPDYPDKIKFGDSRNHSAVKRAVNKAKKRNVTYRIADSIDDLKSWYPLYLETMRFHSTPARSFNFYKDCWNLLRPKGLMRLVLAELEQNSKKIIIAGSILFLFNKVVSYAYNGSSRKHFELRPNDILHWQAIFDAQKEGYKFYNLGEVSKTHSGLAAYKKKWASDTLQMYHYYFPKIEQDKEECLDSITTRGIKQRVWQLLPLGVTAKIGEFAYKKL